MFVMYCYKKRETLTTLISNYNYIIIDKLNCKLMCKSIGKLWKVNKYVRAISAINGRHLSDILGPK